MDVMGKLVELLKEVVAIQECSFGDPRPTYETVASYLIAHGVTVQEWISVDDRLPDLISYSAGIAYSETVIVLTSGRNETIAVWDGITWLAQFDFCELWGEKITHWMPIPHPPEGE